MTHTDLTKWLDQQPDIESIFACVCDLNGILRGKRVLTGQVGKILDDGLRIPLLVIGVDVWGEDIENSELVFETRDADGICEFTGRGVTRKHGFAASFMAKPYGNRAGSGLHIHFSLIDSNGVNVFDNDGDEGTELLRDAVAGLLATMAENTLTFGPHENSYRRLTPGEHAPSAVAWGYENRTTAIRIPDGNPKARRIEHRVAGADANPYLVLCAVLGGAVMGIENGWQPADPIAGDAYSMDLPHLPLDWASAIEAFEKGPYVAKIFSPRLKTMPLDCKKQEHSIFKRQVTEFEYHSYLEVV